MFEKIKAQIKLQIQETVAFEETQYNEAYDKISKTFNIFRDEVLREDIKEEDRKAGMSVLLTLIATWAVKFLYDIMGENESIFDRIESEVILHTKYMPINRPTPFSYWRPDKNYIYRANGLLDAMRDMKQILWCASMKGVMLSENIEKHELKYKYIRYAGIAMDVAHRMLRDETISVAAIAVRFLMDLIEPGENEK